MTHGKLRKSRSINLEDEIVFTLDNNILYLEEKKNSIFLYKWCMFFTLDNTI